IGLVQAVLDSAKLKAESLDNALALAPSDRSAIADALRKAGAKPLKPAFQLDAETLKSYAGAYEGQGGEINLVPDKTRLLMKFGERRLYTLTPTDKTHFKPIGETLIAVSIDRKGDTVTGFTFKTAAATSKFTRSEPKKAERSKPAVIEEAPVHVKGPLNW